MSFPLQYREVPEANNEATEEVKVIKEDQQLKADRMNHTKVNSNECMEQTRPDMMQMRR